MSAELFSIGVAIVVFIGGVIGLQLQLSLPEGYTSGGPRDMIGAVVGLVTLLLALVLGLLIWTAFGVYSTEKFSIQTLAINALKFDGALTEFGPDAMPGRKISKAAMEQGVAVIWGRGYDGDFLIKNYKSALAHVAEREAFLESLHPTTEKQKSALATAAQAATAIGQTRTQLALALVDPISYPLLCVIVAWATCLFCGFGLLSKRHPMAFVILAVGSLAIGSAIYIIVDLSDPYSGLLQVSPKPLTDVISVIDAEEK